MKICKVCKIEKPMAEFHKDKYRSDGHSNTCKSCKSDYRKAYYSINRQRELSYIQKWQKRNPDKHYRINRRSLLKKYGLTEADYHTMLKNQKHRCAICGSNFGKIIHIDHCHQTGQVRGLLCPKCNRSLGLIGEDVNTLKAMIEYLNKNLYSLKLTGS